MGELKIMAPVSDGWFGEESANVSSGGTSFDGIPTVGLSLQDEIKTSTWSHYGPLIIVVVGLFPFAQILSFFAFVVPVLMRQTAGRKSDRVKQHATESLNFSLTYAGVALIVTGIGLLVTAVTFGLAWLLFLPLLFTWQVFAIVLMAKAGRAAKRGDFYRYPLTVRLIKVEMP